MNSKYLALIVILGIVLCAISGLGGYYYSMNKLGASQKGSEKAVVETSPIFQTQTATILGKVSRAEGGNATVKGANNLNETFPVSNKFVLYKAMKNTNQATPSSDLSLIDPNQDAFINLEIIDGKYQIVSITYLPTMPSAPAIPAPKI